MPSFGGDTLAAVSADALDPTAAPADLEWLRQQFPANGAAIFSTLDDAQREALAQRNSWDLVAYILTLRDRSTTAQAVLGPTQAGG